MASQNSVVQHWGKRQTATVEAVIETLGDQRDRVSRLKSTAMLLSIHQMGKLQQRPIAQTLQINASQFHRFNHAHSWHYVDMPLSVGFPACWHTTHGTEQSRGMRRSKKTSATDRAALQGALSDLVGSLDTLRPADIGRKAKEIANILPSGLSYDDLHDVLREELAALTGHTVPRKHRTEYDDALAVDFEDIRSVDGDRSAAELLAALAEPDEDADEPAVPTAAVEESEAPVDMWFGAADNVTFDDTPRSTIIDQP